MIGILQGFAIIFFVIAAGYILARTKLVRGDERLVLNRVAFYVATPALIFDVVSTSPPRDLLSPVVVASTLAGFGTAALFAVLAFCFFRTDRASMTMGAASTGYVNSNNIGLPVGIYALGSAAYVAPLLLVQMVIMTPIILALITEATIGEPRVRIILRALRTALLSPIVLASFAGLLVSLYGAEVTPMISEPMHILGGASIPMVLMSFGASLYSARPLSDARYRPAAITATAMKTIGMPIIAWVIGLAMGLAGEALYAVVILATLPTAQNVYNYAATYQRGEVVARDTILLSTFLALPAMLAVAALFGR